MPQFLWAFCSCSLAIFWNSSTTLLVCSSSSAISVASALHLLSLCISNDKMVCNLKWCLQIASNHGVRVQSHMYSIIEVISSFKRFAKCSSFVRESTLEHRLLTKLPIMKQSDTLILLKHTKKEIKCTEWHWRCQMDTESICGKWMCKLRNAFQHIYKCMT